MATINQLTKQIATANKRIADFDKKIEMYTVRTNKVIDGVNKATGLNITINEVREEVISKQNRPVFRTTSLDKKFKDVIGWEQAYKIENNYQYMKENERDKERELRNIARLEEELASLEQAKSDKEKAYNNTLENALRESMKNFEQAWYERMVDWFGKHYDHIKEITPGIKAKHARVRNILNRLLYSHKRIRRSLEQAQKRYGDIIMDTVNRFDSRDEYMGYCKEKLHAQWNAGVIKLTEKCQVFGVDEANVKVGEPKLTSKGFEVYIADNNQRTIHARVIWAAEYSMIIQTHTRYIVTEKRNK